MNPRTLSIVVNLLDQVNRANANWLDAVTICARQQTLLEGYADRNDELAAQVKELTAQRDDLLKKLCVMRLEHDPHYTEIGV